MRRWLKGLIVGLVGIGLSWLFGLRGPVEPLLLQPRAGEREGGRVRHRLLLVAQESPENVVHVVPAPLGVQESG